MTPTTHSDPTRLKFLYEWDAERYLRSLPLEHFMETTPQATQREITLESFALIRATRPDVHVFNELLVQYPVPGEDPDQPARVVPDNMVVIHSEPIRAEWSFMTPLQPAGPFLVLEYVSNKSRRKDYDDNYRRYERDLRVPYYLLFYPDNEELTVFRLAGDRYVIVTPNDAGRLPIPELELEVALHGGWVRFWFRGELLPLPGELLAQLNGVRDQLGREQETRLAAEHRAAAEREARVVAERREEAERTIRVAAELREEAERTVRLALEAELARVKEELAKVTGQKL